VRRFSLSLAESSVDALLSEADADEVKPLSHDTSSSIDSSHLLGVPSDDDLEYILSLVNLAHLTKGDYGTRAGVTKQKSSHAAKRRAAAFAPTPTSSAPSPSSAATAGLDVLCEWSSVLSLGEAQRVSFARVLLHQPAYAFCDEVTAALDAHNEELLYAALAQHAPNTVLLSVGHRPALLRHHSHVLHLQDKGRWNLLEVNERNRKDIERITALAVTE